MSEGSISIEVRTPVINSENAQKYPLNEIDRQWGLITEAVRREIINSKNARKSLIQFCKTPVSETLPDQFIQTMSASDQRIAMLANRYNSGIKEYTELPAVPDEQIKPDIRNTKSFSEPNGIINYYAKIYGKDTLQYEEKIKDFIESGFFLKGVTGEEKQMVAKRYKYARDIKLLALGAEIVDQGGVTPNTKGEFILSSGVRMVIDLKNNDQRTDLLSPHLWEKRKQLKDRVYEIDANGRKYILKEKKTARHTDTMSKGHRDGRLSSEEFEIAKHLQEKGVVSKNEISVNWERPVGYVEYPDGFSFVVFEYEEGLIERKSLNIFLAKKIFNHKDQFMEEYQTISKLTDKYKNSPEVLASESDQLKTELKLSFAEFALVKALRMERQALELMEETITKNGYSNIDANGYSFRVKEGDRLQLEIVGFDFEYFSKISPDQITERLEKHKHYKDEWELSQGVGFTDWGSGLSVTRMQKAAYLAMLESEGIVNNNN